jgi:hypothetical protein
VYLQGTAGNLFLVKGESYDDFIALFTAALNAKPETVIRKYKERSQIEQTNKELKSYLRIEESYFRKRRRIMALFSCFVRSIISFNT